MNKKKRNARHLYTWYHHKYLFFLPLILIVFGAFFLWSVEKARQDQRYYADWLRGLVNEDVRPGITYYKIEFGDTLETIANKFDISVETIVWANDLPPEGISPDMIITIPPVTGTVHTVLPQESIESIARLYGVNPSAIRGYRYNVFNDDPAAPISPGQTLIVPGGRKDGITLQNLNIQGVWDKVRKFWIF